MIVRAFVFLAIAPVVRGAQSPRTIPGFGMGYVPPAGWTLSGAEGRVEAWGRPGTSGALFVFGGSYSTGELAIADGATVLQGARLRENATKVLEPPAPRRVGGVDVWTTAARVQAQSGETVVLRILVRPSGNGTMLGVVSLAAPAEDAAVRAAAEQVIGTARPGTPVPDRAGTAALAGAWRRQESNMSSSGGYVSEEGWDFAADGRMTLTVRRQGREADIAGTRFVKR